MSILEIIMVTVAGFVGLVFAYNAIGLLVDLYFAIKHVRHLELNPPLSQANIERSINNAINNDKQNTNN